MAMEGQEDGTSPAGAVRCLLLPLRNTFLLVPNTLVAEVCALPGTISPVNDAPPWLLGQVDWRQRPVPVVAFEALLGGQPVGAGQLAVVNTLNRNADLPFVGITISGMPTLLQVDSDAVGEDDDHSGSPLVLSHVTVGGSKALIPHIDGIEQRLLEVLARGMN